jgi:Asp-tRNA(Asn)/Glu-tRNA(Gln) amidotransferase A subunit family amidase
LISFLTAFALHFGGGVTMQEQPDQLVSFQPYLPRSSRFSSGLDTPSAFLERCLARVRTYEPQIGAFVHLEIEGAQKQAEASTQRWRAGKPLSPIDGMPVGIKDVIETLDMPTEMGSPLFAGWRSERDSASVKALREAGAIILGKTVTTEFAATVPGGTRNPFDLRRTPGGSSSGSAAGVAAGFFSAGLGTQVVGSIIRPASYCGCVGFKPTFGAVNRGGSHDFMSQSSQGVLAASLEDAWQILREIVDRCGGDAGHQGLTGPAGPLPAEMPRTLVFLETPGWTEVSAGARSAFEMTRSALEREGIDILTRYSDERVEKVESALTQAMPLTRLINAWESRWPLNTYRDRGKGLSDALLARLKEAEGLSLEDNRRALSERARIREAYAGLAECADAIVTLSAPDVAPVGLQSTGDPQFALPSAFLGVPSVSLPLMKIGNLPLGLQLIGFEHRDAQLVGYAAAIQAVHTGSAQ